ncbi:carboxylate-amine ligase [Rhodococcus spongiicola]|uniref:Putative glutamate--cysteine ligase 2 n=1 Tax=Rhodococcus spongiicola TaxID=2487352 RepID=A0A438AP38_9NOCA|nr:glutamate--cysteine ligase [Rhodococcus spongiicola]RVW00409.1 YbdK family carboxylate-amine ligase [Rhodococcus spongiicola]
MSERANSPTIGVEEEFLLVDPVTGRLRMENEAVGAEAKRIGIDLQPELGACQVETATGVCRGVDDLRRELIALRSGLAEAARQRECRPVAVGVPVTGPPEQEVSDVPRYRAMERQFGILARQHGICGCHVHVAVPDRDAAIQVGNRLRPWLPSLLALTANSPIHYGADTGCASWRSILWRRWPATGPPPVFADAQEYDRVVMSMIDCGAILDERMVYWDVRPSGRYPTVEIRVSDVPATADETVLLALLVQGLVVAALRDAAEGLPVTRVPEQQLEAAYWRAARDGLEGLGVDPFSARCVPARVLVEKMVESIQDALEENGTRTAVVAGLRKRIVEGSGARRQRRALRRARAIADVVADAADRTMQGCTVAPTVREPTPAVGESALAVGESALAVGESGGGPVGSIEVPASAPPTG